MYLDPIGEHVVLKQREAEEVTKGGVLIPSQSQQAPQEGTVLAVGHGYRNMDGTYTPLKVKPGDVVVYSEYGGSVMSVDGESYLIIREANIYAILHRETAEERAKIIESVNNLLSVVTSPSFQILAEDNKQYAEEDAKAGSEVLQATGADA